MKNPWFAFSGICALVLGIVLFCVVFGGYSSLLRSQNRIQAVTQLLIDECSKQVDMISGLINTAGPVIPEEAQRRITTDRKALNAMLIRMKAAEQPMPQALITEFESVQARIKPQVEELVKALQPTDNLSEKELEQIRKEARETEMQVFYTARRYNTEARYFNTRTHVFPVSIIARIFGLDRLNFPEIAAQLIAPPEAGSAT